MCSAGCATQGMATAPASAARGKQAHMADVTKVLAYDEQCQAAGIRRVIGLHAAKIGRGLQARHQAAGVSPVV